ncbi:transposase [Desulfonatronum parangueonense]
MSNKKPYWGNHFWARGYCVDTVGLDSDKKIYEATYEQRDVSGKELKRIIGGGSWARRPGA